MFINKKNLPSRKIARAFRIYKDSIVWKSMNDKNKKEELFNHRLELKAQLNREFCAKHFGFTLKELADDIITDEEIKALLAAEAEIAAKVEQEMTITVETKNSRKRTASRADGNMNHLFA